MRNDEIAALRSSVVWTHEPAVVCLRLGGDDAFALLDRVCPADLFVRDGQVRPSVLLDEQARVIADVYVGQDDESYLLMAEGMPAAHLIEHLTNEKPAGARVAIEEVTAEHDVVSIHGPYAWELIGELLGPDLIGLPYLYFYRTGDLLCLRGGKTGEYGYDLFVPKAQVSGLEARIEEQGKAFDLVRAGASAFDQCALENGFFNMRREGRRGLTPIELGQQWRVSYRKDYVGAEALRAQRAAGVARRATYLTSNEPLGDGDGLWLGGARVGEVLAAGESPTLGGHVALALIDRPYYHAGIDGFTTGPAAAAGAIASVSPPVLNNRSLYVNPQRHAYATRARDTFPALV